MVIRLADDRQVSVQSIDVRRRFDGEMVVSIYAEPAGRMVAMLRPTDRVIWLGGY